MALSLRDAAVQTLHMERRKATFDIRSLTHFLDGGREMTEISERIMKEFAEDPLMSGESDVDQTLPEIREIVMKRIIRLWEYFSMDDSEAREKRVELLAIHDPQLFTRMGVHFGLFLGTISGQGTPEQQDEWATKAALLQIVGCFAMTELGHGSFVRGVETTAEFDENADEIVINSPSETATKWWIGGAAHSATHSVVFGQLIVNKQRKGVHVFVVPLRDPETGETLPGIEIGDLGAKMGRHGIDNGWIRFDHVRIPRTNMLMKHAKLERDGGYTKPAKAQLAYGALVSGRAAIMRDAANALKAALTIAIRYAAVRRQFVSTEEAVEGSDATPFNGETTLPNKDSLPSEVQVLDYRTHQHKLFPLLATAYAFHFTAARIKLLNDRMEHALHSGDIDEALPLLADVHASSAGLKAFCTWTTQGALEVCRQSLGGHGYSAYTGIATMAGDFAINCTWEGDNTVLALQTAKSLISTAKKALSGEEIIGSMSYLSELRHPKPVSSTIRSFGSSATPQNRIGKGSIDELINVLQSRCLLSVRRTLDKIMQLEREGENESDIWNDVSVDLLDCAKAHCIFFMAKEFNEAVEGHLSDIHSLSGRGVKAVLSRLLLLFILYEIDRDAGAFLREGIISPSDALGLHSRLRAVEASLRPDAVALVDAFNFHDGVLKSPLGARDGDVYGRYIQRVRKANPPPSKAPYWDAVIKPRVSKL